jgi:hypothetical protein
MYATHCNVNKRSIYVIGSFRPKVDEKCAHLGYWVSGFVTLEDGTDRLS